MNSARFTDSLNKCLFSTYSVSGILLGVGIWGETHGCSHSPLKVYHVIGMTNVGLPADDVGPSGRNRNVKQRHLPGEKGPGKAPCSSSSGS